MNNANISLLKENELLRQEIPLLSTYSESDEERENKRKRTESNSSKNWMNERIKKTNS